MEKYLALTLPGGETIDNPSPIGDVTLEMIVGFLVSAAFFVAVLVALLYLIIGGYRWITSGGDSEKIVQARNTIIYAVVGLIVIAIAIFIVQFVGEAFGIAFFDFSPSGGAGGGNVNI